jgi:Holliday junction resolvasome RuvABC endonuclease subunit
MLKTNKSRILAIDPGTRHLGVALLENGRPKYQGVKTITDRTSAEAILREGHKLMRGLIRDYRPTILAVEKTFFGKSRNVALLNVLADEIVATGKRSKIQVIRLAPTTIRKQLCGNGRATKEDVMRVVIAKFPEFKVFATQDRKWKDAYHRNMFDAMALGLVVYSNKEKSKNNQPLTCGV